jgi:hypothetical protein
MEIMHSRALGLVFLLCAGGCLPRKVLTQAKVDGKVTRGGIPFVGAKVHFTGGFAGRGKTFDGVTDGQGGFRFSGEEGWRWYVMASETEYRWRLSVDYEGTELAKAVGRAVGDFHAPEALVIDCDVDRPANEACTSRGGGTQLGGRVEAQ